MKRVIKEAFTFDDVLLVPQFSDILPSTVSVKTRLTGDIHLAIPLISADMDTVTESGMAIAMAKAGGVGIIHKNFSIEKQAQEVNKVKNKNNKHLVGASIGVGDEALKRAQFLIGSGVDFVVISTAHGHSKGVLQTIKAVKKKHQKLEIIAGNVVSREGTKALIDAGAAAVKVGVGPGSICTTRIIAGVGVPQLAAIEECVLEARKYKIPVIADGGIKHSGDIVKALAMGASSVMIGGLFAGCDESPGKIIEVNGEKYKTYRGMGSKGALKKGSRDRYFQRGMTSKKLVPEGVEGQVRYSGPLSEVIYRLIGGIKSGCGYLGAANLKKLQEKAVFVRITSASLRESYPHDIFMTKDSPNY